MLLRTFCFATLLLINLILLTPPLTGQSSNTDSLEKRLIIHKAKDTTRVNLLNSIAYSSYTSDVDKTKRFADESYELAKKLGYVKGQAESLWLQGIICTSTDPEKALVYYENALELVKKINHRQGVGKYTNAIGTAYGVTGRDSLAVKYYLRAIEIAKEINDLQELGKYRINLSQAYNRMGMVELALKGYNDALEALKTVDDKHRMAVCYNSLGNIYTIQGNYPIALESYHNGLKISEKRNDLKAVSKSLVSIGSIYFAQKDYSKALEYNQRVKKIAESSNDQHALAGSLLNIGLIYLHTNNNSALQYFRKALEIGENLRIVPLQISILLNIGQLYYKESKADQALANFLEALELAERKGIISSISNIKLQIAKVYFDKKELSQALRYADESLNIAENQKIIETEKELHKLLSELYASKGNYKRAYSHSQLFKQLSDKLYNENNVRKITELEYTYKFEKERQAIALEQHKKDEVQAARRKQQHAIIVVLATSFILVSILAIYIHRLYRFRIKANQVMREMEAEKKRMLEQEIEHINHELELNQKSLTAASLKLIQNSERDADTIRRLEAILENTTPEGKRIIQSIKSDFKRISRSSNWSEFELLFQKVHTSFYEKLNASFPDLTANERKLCAFLKLNMSSKDIANITFQSEEALKKARQRLRQKLGIERDTNLVSFLQNI